ncbi:MAG: DNA repair protein RadC [Nanoarchaeota archaeon]|nr:DNA repair protein RadC [Nanoarchaeota archaeon]
MRIKDMPWWNRPSNRIKKKGEDKLNPAELLSLIIWGGKKGENAIDMSNRLLKKSSFSKISEMSLTKLEKEVGKIGAARIKAMYEIFKLTNWVKRGGFKPTIESAKDVYNYFVDELKDKKKEYFYALLLDSKNRIIKEELISVGTLNSSLVHPREVFKEAIKASANAIVLVHNHPDSDSEPSENDIEVTKRLAKSADILNIKILDHVIIGKDGWDRIKINYD